MRAAVMAFFAVILLLPHQLFAGGDKAQVKQMEMFEASLEYDTAGINPYDYSKVIFKATFRSPSSKRTEVEGFYSENFIFDGKSEYEKNGGSFKARFVPKEPGEWKYRMELSVNGAAVTTTAWESFDCKRNSDSRGYIRISPVDPLFMEFENKEPFFGKGINMGWAKQDRVYEDYKYWIEKFSENGGNLIRVLMAPWSFGIETDRLCDYSSRQKQAAELDQVFALCAEHDIYIQLCLDAYSGFSDDLNPGWAGNPYNSRNDGILDSPREFFTSKLARDFFKNRLRYITARWGYSRNLFAWELFSESDMVPGHSAESVLEWHRDIFSYIKKHDKNKHPVSASFFDSEKGAAVWQLEECDFTQTHIYNLKDAAEELYNLSRGKTEKYNKPHIVSEFGTATAMEEMDNAKDEKGVQLHTAIWGGALSLSMGWPMIWWWDVYVDRYGLWDIYRPLSGFLHGVNWARGDYFLLRSEKAYYYDAENKPAGSVRIYPEDRQVRAKKNRFIITPAGDVTNKEYFTAYLYGKNEPDKKNDPVFVMTNRFPAKLIISVSRVSGNCALAVEVNGERALSADINGKTLPNAAPEKGTDIYSADCALSYTVDLHAGDNEVALINTGSGRVKIDYLEVTDFTDPQIAPVFLAGIQNEAAAYIWYKHKNYTWQNTPADKVEGAYIDVPDLRPGRYVIEFYDTYTGDVINKKQVIKHEEDLRVELPEFYTDGAVKIKEYK